MTAAIDETHRWIADFVVGLGLCPFAKQPLDSGRIRIVASETTDIEEAMVELAREFIYLDESTLTETTLLVFTTGWTEFDAYLDLLDFGSELLEERGYEGTFQLASFHPDYCFEGNDTTDPANATNRSPYPMLHVLREASVEAAVASHPDPKGIPARNEAKLREL